MNLFCHEFTIMFAQFTSFKDIQSNLSSTDTEGTERNIRIGQAVVMMTDILECLLTNTRPKSKCLVNF